MSFYGARRKGGSFMELNNLSDFARQMYEKHVPADMRDRVDVLESSKGDEQMENFIQSYSIEKNPEEIYLVSFFDAGIDSDPDWFCVHGASCDDERCDDYAEFYKIWLAEWHPEVMDSATYFGEIGPAFRRLKDALRFSRDFRIYEWRFRSTKYKGYFIERRPEIDDNGKSRTVYVIFSLDRYRFYHEFHFNRLKDAKEFINNKINGYEQD